MQAKWLFIKKQGQAEVEEDGRSTIVVLIIHKRSFWVCLHDVCRWKRWSEASSRLLTSSTTKLSSLLSASLPCERRERERRETFCSAVCMYVCILHVGRQKQVIHKHRHLCVHNLVHLKVLWNFFLSLTSNSRNRGKWNNPPFNFYYPRWL